MKINKMMVFPVKHALILVTVGVFLIMSCDRIKQKTKSAINKTGETVGKGTSEFFKGVSEGVDQTFQCKVEISKSLSDKGVTCGKFKIASGQEATDNLLTIYLIFNKDFKDTLSAKVLDEKGQEYGRTSIYVEGRSGEANYYDFIFEKRTDIESKSTFIIE